MPNDGYGNMLCLRFAGNVPRVPREAAMCVDDWTVAESSLVSEVARLADDVQALSALSITAVVPTSVIRRRISLARFDINGYSLLG